MTASGNAQRANDSMICAILETKKMRNERNNSVADKLKYNGIGNYIYMCSILMDGPQISRYIDTNLARLFLLDATKVGSDNAVLGINELSSNSL